MNFNSQFDEELEALEAIYMDDLIINIDELATLQMTLHPATADDDDKKFVCLTLICTLTKQYPEKKPSFDLKNPRGLSDAHLASIKENLEALAGQKIGEMMLYDLLEYARGSLTDNNHPSCVCPICLEYFKEEESFFRTECYHYFHFPCIQGYVKSVTEKHICPVCRLEINDKDVETILNNNSKLSIDFESDKETSYTNTHEYKKWLAQCKAMFDKQKQKGGIIDLDYERNKYLIPSAPTPAPSNELENEDQPTELEPQANTPVEHANNVATEPKKPRNKNKQGKYDQGKTKQKESHLVKESSHSKPSKSNQKQDKTGSERNFQQANNSKTSSNGGLDERPSSSKAKSKLPKEKSEKRQTKETKNNEESKPRKNTEGKDDSPKPKSRKSVTEKEKDTGAKSVPQRPKDSTRPPSKNHGTSIPREVDQASSSGLDKENTATSSKSKKKRHKKKTESQHSHKAEGTNISSTGDNQKTGSKKPSKVGWANVPANTSSNDDKEFPSLGGTKDTPTDRGKAAVTAGRCEPKPPPGFERKVRPPPGFKPI